MEPKHRFVLPSRVAGPADVGRLLMELERWESAALAAKARQHSSASVSASLRELAELSQADLTVESDRHRLEAFLESLQQAAPVIHISFAAEPSAAFTAKIVEWMRANISAYALVQVGLQPSIAAGCVVRTTNKVFDLSLGRFLRTKRHVLTEILRQQRQQPVATAAPSARGSSR